MTLRIHAICLALNEELFIEELLKSLCPFCSGISILTQYDRDWYGKPVKPDATVQKVLNFPDPEGKIHLVMRRFMDQTAARNHEMLALNARCARSIQTHGVPKADVLQFHQKPDYFLIVDADEIYDVDTFDNIVDYLADKRPRVMRVLGYNYVRTWNRRVPPEIVRFQHVGFIRPDILFEQRRIITWNQGRLSKFLSMLRLPDFSSKLFGFIDCPPEVGAFHHGCWLGDDARLKFKFATRSYDRPEWSSADYLNQINSYETIYIPKSELPRNIREGNWPDSFFED